MLREARAMEHAGRSGGLEVLEGLFACRRYLLSSVWISASRVLMGW